MENISRRSLFHLGGATMAAALTPASRSMAASPAAAESVLMTPAYGAVSLKDGPLLAQFQAQHATLMAMNEDALLKPFREAAGLPAPGPVLGGWYNASPNFDPPSDMDGYIPGHCFGQYVSSLARAYALTGDRATQEKVQRLVAGFAPTITSRFYDDYPLPAYTFDKIVIGLIDAHSFANDPRAFAALDLATDAALPHLPKKALTREEMAARPHPNIAFTWDESYTLPENLYLAWQRGAGDRYRALAPRYLLDRAYFDPLARGENVLAGLHAYSHVNALSSAMQAYFVEGSVKHLTAAKNGFDFILAQSFATGGWGPNETLVAPGAGTLGKSLTATHASFETPCGCYGHFKAVRYLMQATGEAGYGDSMERLLYNAVLGALPMKPDGTAFYYSDYNEIGSKFYHHDKCTCCSGTLGQVVADYAISSYFTNDQGVFVNLYVPSRLRWQRAGRDVMIEQTTAYPLDAHSAIRVATATAQTFTLALRIPAWAGAGTMIRVNGKRHHAPIVPGAFHRITREWHDGDRLTLDFDMPLRLEAVDDRHPDLVALWRGPLALFAVNDVSQTFPSFRRAELLNARQSAAYSPDWRVTGAAGSQRFMPFYAIGSEKTRLYQALSV